MMPSSKKMLKLSTEVSLLLKYKLPIIKHHLNCEITNAQIVNYLDKWLSK